MLHIRADVKGVVSSENRNSSLWVEVFRNTSVWINLEFINLNCWKGSLQCPSDGEDPLGAAEVQRDFCILYILSMICPPLFIQINNSLNYSIMAFCSLEISFHFEIFVRFSVWCVYFKLIESAWTWSQQMNVEPSVWCFFYKFLILLWLLCWV